MTKIDILLKVDQNQEFSTSLTKIEIYSKFWANSIFSKILGKIEVFFKILTKISIILSVDQNRHFCKFWPNSRIFDNFVENRDFSKNLTKFEIFRQFSLKSIFPKILTKIYPIFLDIFDPNRHICKFWPKSPFFEILTKTNICGKFLPKILSKIEIFRKCCPRSRFSDNFDQNRDFHKFLPRLRFT